MLQGIFLDDFGNVAEGPTMNVAILTKDGEFVASLAYYAKMPSYTCEACLVCRGSFLNTERPKAMHCLIMISSSVSAS